MYEWSQKNTQSLKLVILINRKCLKAISLVKTKKNNQTFAKKE